MKNFIYGGVLAVGLLFSSCNDTLDIDPNDSYSDATVWQDQNLIKMFVNDQYGALIGSDDFYRYSFFQMSHIKNIIIMDVIMCGKIF